MNDYKEKLITAKLPLLHCIAGTIDYKGDIDDIISVGSIGLIKHINTFDDIMLKQQYEQHTSLNTARSIEQHNNPYVIAILSEINKFISNKNNKLHKTQTNREWLNSLSDDEQSKFIVGMFYKVINMARYEEKMYTANQIQQWLQAEHKEEQ